MHKATTPPAASSGPGFREVDRFHDKWKDKIEIRLDNRQVAFLFFGSALIACLLFILGVIVGKRLESRGHAIAPEIEDPLALLDRVASSLPGSAPARPPAVAVSRAPVAPKRVESGETLGVVTPRAAAALTAPAAVTAPTDEPEPIAKAPKPAPAAVKTVAAPPAVPAAAKVLPPTEQPRPSSPELLPPSGLSGNVAAVPSGGVVAGAPAPGKGRFVLQVGSAFQDKAEAEAYARTFVSERPVVVMSELPGKGTWYRVRVGEFRAFKEAVEAKLLFEKRFSKIALVLGPL